MRGKNFADGWVTSYNVIGNDVTELIPGITNPEVCQSLCQLVDSCSHWTLDQDDQGTVKNAQHLTFTGYLSRSAKNRK